MNSLSPCTEGIAVCYAAATPFLLNKRCIKQLMWCWLKSDCFVMYRMHTYIWHIIDVYHHVLCVFTLCENYRLCSIVVEIILSLWLCWPRHMCGCVVGPLYSLIISLHLLQMYLLAPLQTLSHSTTASSMTAPPTSHPVPNPSIAQDIIQVAKPISSSGYNTGSQTRL